MKTRILKCLATCGVLLLFGFMSSCDDDNGGPDRAAEIRTNIKSGSWKITYFFDDTDETHHFAGYAFVFNDDKTVLATKDTQAVSGTWDVRPSSNGNKLVLDFAVTEPFDELNDDWDIKEYSEARIVLEDISGGNGDIDYLTLEKI